MSIRTIADLPFAAAAFGDEPALRYRDGDGWRDQSFAALADAVRTLALGLLEAGLRPGERVCVLSETRPEWTRVGLAAIAAGAVVVPIYPSSSVQECEWVLGDSGAAVVVCENAAQLQKIDKVRDRLPELRVTVLIEPGSSERALADLVAAGESSQRDAELAQRRAAVGPDDPCMIIYTSGTTGPAKGCVLTHRNWLTVCEITEELSYLTRDDTAYLFLPLAHVFAQLVQFACVHSGATLAYFGGDARQVVPELAEIRPTFLPSVPRIFEKLYVAITGSTDPVWLAEAVREGLAARREGRLPAAEPLFAKVRAVLGGRLRLALSGAAPIATPILEFFHAAGAPVVEGYGMTESTGVGTVSTLERHRLGTVGVAAPGLTVALAPDGEILMSGPHVFAGYWNNPGATAETVVDGWLHTGDLGNLDEDGFVTITGRKKDIIITAGGKNISPANLENDLRRSRWISQALVYGDRRPYPVALLTLDPDEILPWAREHGLPDDPAALAAHPRMRELIGAVVDDVNTHHSHAAQVKRFAIVHRDFTQESGELTPTLKLKRPVVQANHADTIAALYAEGGDPY